MPSEERGEANREGPAVSEEATGRAVSEEATGGAVSDEANPEEKILLGIQDKLFNTPAVPVARAMSFFGEHALGWLLLAAAGAKLDEQRRAQWIEVGKAAFISHAASVIIKRIVRRKRPHHPEIRIGVGTPSKLSFPSSHATSTSAALVAISRLLGSPWPLVGVPAMMVSRMVLGVHYPTDVAAGAALGTAVALKAKV